jgi:hypothetical protein
MVGPVVRAITHLVFLPLLRQLQWRKWWWTVISANNLDGIGAIINMSVGPIFHQHYDRSIESDQQTGRDRAALQYYSRMGCKRS